MISLITVQHLFSPFLYMDTSTSQEHEKNVMLLNRCAQWNQSIYKESTQYMYITFLNVSNESLHLYALDTSVVVFFLFCAALGFVCF